MSTVEVPGCFDARRRARVVDGVDGQAFDLVIVGGGINGAGAAHDAALRGLRVLLLEREDIAFGTSSRSSKLIHGGLRYLEQYHFKLVFEGTNERAVLRRNAPHLVRPLMFALPVYEGARHPLWMVDVGLWMYDSLSLFKVERRHITLRSAKRMLEREPLLSPTGMTGGIIYYDCVTDDARLTLENALAAARLGATVVTRAEVRAIDASRERKDLASVEFEDRLGRKRATVSAKCVVNCTGAWTDRTRNLAMEAEAIVRPTKGVHIVLERERLPIRQANALMVPRDGRVFFAIPWNDRVVVGTTDTDFSGDPSDVGVTAEDVGYLLDATNHHFPGAHLATRDVIGGWAGLRPLIAAKEAQQESDVPREHKIYRDGRMVTIAGGKLTTYRRIAAELVDAATEVAGLRCAPSATLRAKLPGALELPRDLDAFVDELRSATDLEARVVRRLVDIYGSRAPEVARFAAEDRSLAERVCPDQPVIYAEVAHAVENELALSVEDVLVRRTSLALTADDNGLRAAGRVADILGNRLGWDEEQRQKSADAFAHSIERSCAFRKS